MLPCLTSDLIVLLMAHCLRAHAVCANAEGVCPRTVPLTGNAIFMYRGATGPAQSLESFLNHLDFNHYE